MAILTKMQLQNGLTELLNQSSVFTAVSLVFMKPVALYKKVLMHNQLRPHSSCDYLTPDQAHLQSGTLKKRWKTVKFTQPINA